MQSNLAPVYYSTAQWPEGTCDTPLPLNAGVLTRDLYLTDINIYLVTVTNRSAFEYAFRLHEKPTPHDRSFAVYYATEDGARMVQPLEELAASYAASGQYTFRTLWQDYSPTSQWAAHRKGITLLVNVFSWGFTVLVFLGVSVSLMGTMSADFVLRRREFAFLRSAGMEQRQMDRFLLLQCLSYCAGLPFGVLLGVVPCVLFSRALGLPFGSTFSPLAALAGAALLTGVCLLALHSARKNMARLSVVEALRGET